MKVYDDTRWVRVAGGWQLRTGLWWVCGYFPAKAHGHEGEWWWQAAHGDRGYAQTEEEAQARSIAAAQKQGQKEGCLYVIPEVPR